MTLTGSFFAALEAIASVRRDEPLSRHTTIGIGGPADAFVEVRDAEQLTAVVLLCRQHDMPFFVLGSGSNIVVGDKGIRGVVIENNATALDGPTPLPAYPPTGDSSEQRYLFRAESGRSFAATARQLSFEGYAGLEWASGIRARSAARLCTTPALTAAVSATCSRGLAWRTRMASRRLPRLTSAWFIAAAPLRAG